MPRTASISSLLRRRVAQVLDTIRPAMQSDGGDIELVDVTETGVVQVRLLGACLGCPSSENTLKYGVEQKLKDQIAEVTGVVCLNSPVN